MMSGEFYLQPDEALKHRKLIEYKALYIDAFFRGDKSIRILDMGCGHGLFLDACQRSGYLNYEGVDNTKEFVDYAVRELQLKNIVQSDVFEYLKSRPAVSYDVITAFNLIEHLKKEKVPELLGLVFHKLKSRGRFFLEVPNADSPIGIHTLFSDLTHEFAYTKSLMVQLLEQAGFQRTQVLPNRVRSNPIIRICQKILAKIVGFDDKLMFSGNLIGIGYKE